MQLILQDHVEVPVSVLSLVRHLYLSFSTPTFLKCENPKITIRNNLPLETVTDSCRDGWNVRNCSSGHVQVFWEWWSVQIGDGWHVWNWLNMNFLKLVKIWIWILQNLYCLSCKSTNLVLVVKPTLMPLFWMFGLCLFFCF